MKSFNRQFQLGKPEIEAVEWAWQQEQGETLFHVITLHHGGPLPLADG